MLVSILMAMLIFAFLFYVVRYLPHPMNQIANVVVAIIAIIWLVGLLTGRHYLGF